MRVIVQQVRDLPARCTSPACARRFSAAVTACGLGPQPVPVMNPMWRLIQLGIHHRRPAAQGGASQCGEYLIIDAALVSPHDVPGWLLGRERFSERQVVGGRLAGLRRWW